MGKFEAETEQVSNELGSFDTRTEKSIRTMLIPTQRKARQFMKDIGQAGLSQGLTARIISGTRTFDEQNKLYAQGRTSPGNVVTNARAGYSNHNFGIAWDVGIFNEKGDYIDDLIDKKMMTPKAVDAEYKEIVFSNNNAAKLVAASRDTPMASPIESLPDSKTKEQKQER